MFKWKYVACCFLAAWSCASCDEKVNERKKNEERLPQRQSEAGSVYPGTKPLPSGEGARRELREYVNKVNLDSPQEGWIGLDQFSLEGEKLREAKDDLVGRMSAEKGLEATLSFLKSQLGKGTDRQRLIEVAFSYSKDSGREQLRLLNLLERPEERLVGANALQLNENLSYKDFGVAGKLSAESLNLFVNKLSLAVSSASDKNLQAKECFELVSEQLKQGTISPAMSVDLVKRMSVDSPFETWTALQASGTAHLLFSANREASEAVVRNMMSLNPQRGVSLLIAEKADPWILETAFSQWLKTNNGEVIEWSNVNLSGLSPAQRGALDGSLANQEAESGDFKEARMRIEGIEDADIRQAASGKILEIERRKVVESSKLDPHKAVEAMLMPDSPYSKELLNVAVTEWLIQDSDAAWKWYSDRNNMLNGQQKDEFAMSYARFAIQNGQIETARQWNSQITSVGFKQQIEKEIEEMDSE